MDVSINHILPNGILSTYISLSILLSIVSTRRAFKLPNFVFRYSTCIKYVTLVNLVIIEGDG